MRTLKSSPMRALLAFLLAISCTGKVWASVMIVLDVDGAITPATADYIMRGLASAERSHADLVVLRMDTPGGLDKSMRNIIKQIIASPVPVATFVAPDGARAASAGTYILYASHIAAMTLASNIGAATPVAIGLDGMPTDDAHPNKNSDQGSMERKRINDAVAYLRSLAQMRGRNIQWAEQSVRNAESLTASEALKTGVIDLIASDLPDLAAKLDGRRIKTIDGWHLLKLSDLHIVPMQPDWHSKVLAVIAEPNVAYLLLLAGIFGLFFEFSNPGFVLPGVAGAISLLLALSSFEVLPIDYAGVALILLGIAFMAGEIFISGFGVFGVGGIIAFVFGSLMLFDTGVPGYGIPLAVVVPVAIFSLLFVSYASTIAIATRRLAVVTGQEELMGSLGNVLKNFGNNEGLALMHGETWRIKSRKPLHLGQSVSVTGINGLTLQVEPADKNA